MKPAPTVELLDVEDNGDGTYTVCIDLIVHSQAGTAKLSVSWGEQVAVTHDYSLSN